MVLLGLVGSGKSYGYELKTTYDKHFSFGGTLATGQIYATLSRLVRDRLILSDGAEASHGPKRKKYKITSDGMQKLNFWLTDIKLRQKNIQLNVFAKTVIAALLDQDTDSVLDIQRRSHLAKMRTLTLKKNDASPMQLLAYDLELFHLEADLRWMDTTATRIALIKQEALS